jgi:hypothetical protein
MEKYIYFPTWKEKKDVMVSSDRSFILKDYATFFKYTLESISYIDTIEIIEKHYKGERLSVSEIDTIQFLKNSTLSREIQDGCERAKSFVMSHHHIKQSISSDPIIAGLCELTGAKMYGDYLCLKSKDMFQYKDNIRDDEQVILGDIYNCKIDYCTRDVTEEIRLSGNRFDLPRLLVEEHSPDKFSIHEIHGNIYCPCVFVEQFVTYTGAAELFYSEFIYIDENGKRCSSLKTKNHHDHDIKEYKCNIFHEYSKFLRGEENKFEEVRKVLGV